MAIIRQNLHNHTTHSDGLFSMPELLRAAEASNLEGFAVSDHFFTRKVFRHIDIGSYLTTKWPHYLDEVQTERKKNRRLKVWFGLELDTCLERVGLELHDLPWSDINSLDFLMLEYVAEEDIGGIPLRDLKKIRELCTIPMILAHPHLERIAKKYPLEVVATVLGQTRCAFEMVAGRRNTWFWAKHSPAPLKQMSLTIGADVHEKLDEIAEIDKTLDFLKANNLMDRLVDPDTLKGGLKK